MSPSGPIIATVATHCRGLARETGGGECVAPTLQQPCQGQRAQPALEGQVLRSPQQVQYHQNSKSYPVLCEDMLLGVNRR